MSTNSKESEKKKSPTSNLSTAAITALAFCFYVFIGVLLCYFKIVFGDLCRDETMGYEKFINSESSVNGHHTTPSVFYHSNQDNNDYCKQLYVENTNFINKSTKEYTLSGKDQLLKTLFLESAYSIFGTINVLEDIPDWVIIILGPIIFGLMFLFSILFLWVILSYRIFQYFTITNNLFNSQIIGGIVGFLFWIFIMCFFGLTVTSLTFIYGFFRLCSIIFRSPDFMKVFKNGTEDDKNNSYSFGKYIVDMNSTSSAIHLLFIYGGYVALGNFGKQLASSFVIVALIFFFLVRNQLQFVTIERLLKDGWTTNLNSIDLSTQVETSVGKLIPKANQTAL